MANNGLSAKGMVLAAITGIVLVLYDPMLAVGFCLGVLWELFGFDMTL